MKTLCILGRQPELGVAELESLFGADVVQPIVGGAALLDIDAEKVPFARLGGSIRHCKILTTLHSDNWKELEAHLLKTAPEHAAYINGKLTIGISVYGMSIPPKMIERTCLSLKKLIRSQGTPVRIVMSKDRELSTPQVIHNNLTGPNGWELVFYKNGAETILAQTVHIQDIESYSARDQARPKRDARVGMLPPKLAQTIVNLAVGKIDLGAQSLELGNSQVSKSEIKDQRSSIHILDPFCGTGVTLQEAALMGYDVHGTDIEPRMIEYTIANLYWLKDRFNVDFHAIVETGDAMHHNWREAETITAVACEGYLGTPYSQVPADKYLNETIDTCERIMSMTLRNLHQQLKKGTRLCIGMPAWFVEGRIRHLPCLHNLERLGYTRVEFTHVANKDMIYHRTEQIVGRELVVLIKK